MPGRREVLRRNSRNDKMDDLGGILFYIIAAVIGIVTTVSKKKKKAAKPSVDSEIIDMEVFSDSIEEEETTVYQPIPEGEFENDFWSEIKDDEQLIKDFEHKVNEYSFDKNMEGKHMEPLAEQFSSEGKASVSDKFVKDDIAEEEIPKDDLTQVDQTLKDFDIRTAIIYSEILNRKYY
ncbi:MAG: hypothetical protein QNK33_08005 [Bacteroidales bacterium]|nr:hypothetical protein [Bacteroidales bacterium]